jgi:hypothetical protein
VKQTELGWTAGVIDADGTIGLGKSHQLHVAVTSCTRVITEKLHHLWGGSEWKLKGTTKVGRSLYRWQLTGSEAAWFLDQIKDCLVLKVEQAGIAIEFGSTLGVPGRKVSPEVREHREELVEQLQGLKHG